MLKYFHHDFNGKFAVILDRDGTINFDSGYTHKLEELKFIPGVIDNLVELSNLGAQFFIASNQSGIGRGYFLIKDVENFNKNLLAQLEVRKIIFCGTYICPHKPNNEGFSCACRKPEPGLLKAIIEDFGLKSNLTFFIGNSDSDIAAGEKINLKSFKVVNQRDWQQSINQIRELICL